MSTQAASAATTPVGTLIDAHGWSGYQKWLLVLASLAFLADGIANQALGLAVPALMGDWKLPREAFASVTAIGLIGLTIGAATGGWLGDKIGRRRMLIGSTLLFGVMTLAAARAVSVDGLFWLRFFDGLGIGAAIPNGAALIAEFTPVRRRTRAIAIGMVCIAVGSVLSGLVASVILPSLGWRGLFQTLGAVTIGCAVLFALLLPESPFYLARRGGNQATLRNTLSRCGIVVPESSVVTAGDGVVRSQVATLFAAGTGLSTTALWVAFFFCLLASYAMFSWVPAMLVSLSFPLSMASLGITAFGIGGIVGGVASGWFIERLGSRPSVLGLAAGAAGSALLLGLLIRAGIGQVAPLFAALAVQGFFVSGLHNGLYTLAAHIYPPYARGTGVGAAAAVGRLGAIASSWVGVFALQLGGAASYFLVIASSVAVSFVALMMIRREHHIALTRP
jgi:AAHS family 4-hydroxybenzoate transporter-like MFS transporter